MRKLILFLVCASALAYAGDRAVRHIVSPGYPRLARIAQLQGDVTVEIEISKDGKVASAKAHAGHPILQRASEENARTWTFEPAKEDSAQSIHYHYVLEGRQTYYDPPPKVVFELPSYVEIRSRPYQPQPSGQGRL